MMQNFFKYLNEYFDNIYVITIEPAVHRREKLKKSLAGLNYQFLFGADKAKFSLEELKAKGIYDETATIKHHRYSKTMKPGEVACAWSHRMVFEDMLAKGYENVLVFEDDVVPDPGAVHLIPEILKTIPVDCEFLYWGWAKNGNWKFNQKVKQVFYHLLHSIGLLKWNHKKIRNLFAKPHSQYFKKAGFHEYNNAYSLTRSAAEKLVRLQTPIQFVADNLSAYACTEEIIKGYITSPPVFLHETLPDGTHPDSYIR
jgi:GR25 family glycosyltransferase involved in LPS biosynthesis